MKGISIAITVLFIIGLTACNQKQNDNKTGESTNKIVSPIEGNWITVSFEQNGKVSHPKRVPQQFKMFHDGYFSLVMYDDEGSFTWPVPDLLRLTEISTKKVFPFIQIPLL